MKKIGLKLCFICFIIMFVYQMNRVDKQVIKKKEKEKIVQVMRKSGNEEIELEEYVENVVSCEMNASFEKEALKAQAVAARTFVLKRNLKVDDSVASQVYKNKNELEEIWQESYEKNMEYIHEAVQETKGEVALYNNEYISALFYSHSNGKTNDASWYYKSEVPYLKSVESPWDLEYKNRIQQIIMNKQEVISKLKVNSLFIEDINRYANHYVKEMKIDQKIFTGREIRELLHLRSSDFIFKENQNEVIIETNGYGHGVGMSQYGANGMAKEGYSYQEILKHYYSGIEIKRIK